MSTPEFTKPAEPGPREQLLLQTERPVARFAHPAMATWFELILETDRRDEAAQAARAAFDELERYERELSRFIETSDIARLGRLAAGETMPIGIAAWDCLCIAAAAWEATDGAFDPTLAPLLNWARAGGDPQRDPEGFAAARASCGMEQLIIDGTRPVAGVRTAGMRLDLGAIGKGYAVDKLAELLVEWGFERGMVHGGGSSARLIQPDARGWKLGLRLPHDPTAVIGSLRLRGGSIAGSGVLAGERHIIDPKTGLPSQRRVGAWCVAPTAALSDALSTAFMTMDEPAIEALCGQYPGIGAMVMGEGSEQKTFGDWPQRK